MRFSCRKSLFMLFAVTATLTEYSALMADSSAELVVDRTPGAVATSLGAQEFTEINGIVYFSGNSGVNNRELWRTDGTPAGTYMLKEINPKGSLRGGKAGSDPKNFFNFEGTLYFTAHTDETGRELWKTDGTEQGTVMVRDLLPGPDSGIISSDPQLSGYNGELYFIADMRPVKLKFAGGLLCKTDGTAEGTAVVGGFSVGQNYRFSSVTEIELSGGHLYFNSGASYDQYGIWRLDDGPDGFIRVSALGSDWYSSANLCDVNGTLYATYGTIGPKLVRLGTTTESVQILNPSLALSNITNLTPIGDRLLFSAKEIPDRFDPWVTDGTVAGTGRLTDHTAQYRSSGFTFHPAGGYVWFSMGDADSNMRVWRTDGTSGGTTNMWQSNGFDVFGFQEFDGQVFYFEKYILQGDGFVRLCRSDFPNSNAVVVDDNLYCDMNGSLAAMSNRLLFSASSTRYGGIFDMWSITRGTASASQFLSQTNPDSTIENNDRSVAFKGKLFYTDRRGVADDVYWDSVTVSDGTAAGTSYYSTEKFNEIVGVVNDHLLISDWGYVEVSQTGVPGSEAPLPEMVFSPLDNHGLRDNMVPWGNDRLIYLSNGMVNVTNGTAAGTVALTTTGGSSFRWLISPLSSSKAVMVKQRYESNNQQVGNARELWATDGTAAGTERVLMLADSDGDISNVMSLGNGIGYLPVYQDRGVNGDGAAKLWKTDGTVAETAEVAGSPDFYYVKTVGGNSTHALFTSTEVPHGRPTLWSYSHATNSFTQLLEVVPAGEAVLYKDVLFFAASDGVNGVELWRSDGTPAGTYMVDDVVPGGGSSFPAQLTVIGDLLFMAMSHPAFGYELFALNDVNATPWLVSDINPGSSGSSPHRLTHYPGDPYMYFFADNGTSGQEPFRMKLDGLEPYSAASDWQLYQ